MTWMTTDRSLATLCVLALASGAGFAAPTHESAIRFDEPIAAGSELVIENLVGSIHVLGVGPGEGLRVEGRVVAEGKTELLARELAETVRIAAHDEGEVRVIRVEYPTEQHRQFRFPAVGLGGMFGKWVVPLVRKNSVSLEYGGETVQVGQQRAAAAVSVELTVHLPFDATASLRQIMGSIDLNAARGNLRLEVVAGRILVEQCYGSLEVLGNGGEVAVRRFHGSNLEVHSSAGDVELFDVRSDRVQLMTASGDVRAQGLAGGSMTLRSVSGDVELAQFESESFSIETQSGSVVVATGLALLSGATIASTTGDVLLRVTSEGGFDVAAQTKSGDITAYDMPLEILTEGGQTIARRGRGGPPIEVRTPGGKLTLRSDDGSWTARVDTW